MKTPSISKPILALLVFCALQAPVLGADDQAYRFEMVVFERPDGGTSEYWSDDPGIPNRSLASKPLGSGALVPTDQRELGPAAFTLRRRGMIVHEHVAWEEVPAGRNALSWQWLSAGRLQGLVRFTRGRYLHLDTDLTLQDANAPRTFRIRLNRKMRSDELHYVDHPKVGILIKAKRVEHAEPTAPSDPAAGEPQPASPQTSAVSTG